jgi:hypothetical protein
MLSLLSVIGKPEFQAKQAKRQAEQAEQQAKQAAECAVDLKCLDTKYSAEANVACEKPIERLAKNNFQWFDYPKFSHLRRGPVLGSMTVIGERIKYQNGFGAWIIHHYECDFDTRSKTVLAVRAYPWNDR